VNVTVDLISRNGKPESRRLIVCADDAGWDIDNDDVVAALASAGRISAVSVLVDGPTARDWADRVLSADCALGLHLNLTWTPERGSERLSRLLLAAFARRLSSTETRRRINDQLQRFERLYGRPPAFVDGHQHVHALPVVRDQLLDQLRQRYGDDPCSRPAVRSTFARRWRGVKPLALNMLGGRDLADQLAALEWPCNRDFAGVYDFSESQPYRQRVLHWLSSLADKGLIMVHPGVETLTEHGEARAREAAYLRSADWLKDMASGGVALQRFDASVGHGA